MPDASLTTKRITRVRGTRPATACGGVRRAWRRSDRSVRRIPQNDAGVQKYGEALRCNSHGHSAARGQKVCLFFLGLRRRPRERSRQGAVFGADVRWTSSPVRASR